MKTNAKNVLVVLGAGIWLSACGESSTAAPPIAADGGVDAAPPCKELTLSATKLDIEIDPPRDHHVSFMHDVAGSTYLYVIAGARDEFATVFDDVQRAKVLDDGTLAPFEVAGKLPRKVSAMGLAIVRDTVFLSGGGDGSMMLNGTLVGHFDATGQLTDWKEGPKLPLKVMHPSSVAYEDSIYVLGGALGRAASTMMVHYRVDASGAVTEVESGALASKRSHQAAWTWGSRLYMSGGIDQSPNGNPPPLSDVVLSEIAKGGALGDWSAAGEMAHRISVHNAEVIGCTVVSAGGFDGSIFTDQITQMKMSPDGSTKELPATGTKLSQPRGHIHQLPRKGKYLYAVGGRVLGGLKSVGTVDRISIDSGL